MYVKNNEYTNLEDATRTLVMYVGKMHLHVEYAA